MFVPVVVAATLAIITTANGSVAADDREINVTNVVTWHAPFLSSSSGYGSEATSFLVGLDKVLDEQRWSLAAGLAHGDSVDYRYVSGLPPDLLQLFSEAERRGRATHPAFAAADVAVVVCHSEPGAWSTQEGPRYASPVECPPRWLSSPREGRRRTAAAYNIGRTMFESDRCGSCLVADAHTSF